MTIGKDGQVRLPSDDMARYVPAGSAVFLQPVEDGLMLHTARPDARRVYVEATTQCNLNCAMCVRQVWRDAPGEMSWETFQAVIQGLDAFIRPSGAKSKGAGEPAPKLTPLYRVQYRPLQRVTFGGFGEPLTHPRILDMVRQASALGVGVTMTTNGVQLDRAMARELLAARVDTIIVSLDSMHVQAYRQASLAGGADRVLGNISALSEIVREQHLMAPRIGLAFVVTRSNLHELERLPELAGSVGASFVLVSNLLPHTPQMAGETLYDRDEPLPALPGWPVRSGDWLLHGMARLPRMKWGAVRHCPFVDDRALVVGWDGGVSPCYALMHSYPYYIYGRLKNVTRYVLGTVQQQSLADIWMSEEYVRFRAKVRDFRFGSCVDCGMACSFAQDNEDCLTNTPSCADCLWAQDIIRCP